MGTSYGIDHNLVLLMVAVPKAATDRHWQR